MSLSGPTRLIFIERDKYFVLISMLAPITLIIPFSHNNLKWFFFCIETDRLRVNNSGACYLNHFTHNGRPNIH